MEQENKQDISSQETPAVADGGKNRFKVWLKRVGVGGLIFFTVKGLIWIVVFVGGARFLGCSVG
jgi:hypothetical protein